MRYRLVVLTHGDSATLPRCLASFVANVSPEPAHAVAHYDGSEEGVDALDLSRWRDGGYWCRSASGAPLGFCEATRWAWTWGRSWEAECNYVYYLEHDFVHLRPVNLRDLAAVLDAEPRLAQMALMRGAVNEAERAAGGLFESRPGQYERRTAYFERGQLAAECWLEHRAYLTTNPSLMRREFMAENPWPDYPSECEGRFGLDLLGRGYSFGAWGAGEPWVEHVGERTGFGY